MLQPAVASSVKSLDQDLGNLNRLYKDVLDLLAPYGFKQHSSFAERYGCWEARYFRSDDGITAFISLACALGLEPPISMEVWAGIEATSHAKGGKAPSQRKLAGNKELNSLDPFPSDLIETIGQAVALADEFSGYAAGAAALVPSPPEKKLLIR